MASLKQKKAVVEKELPEVAPYPQTIYCSGCTHWQPVRNDSPFGYCMVSKSHLPAPVITSDYTTCSKAKAL